MTFPNKDLSFSFKQLPLEINELILSFLEQNSLAQLSRVAHFFNDLVNFLYKKVPFISAINKEIVALGYNLPKLSFISIGISTLGDQILFLNLLRQHRGIRQNLDIIKKIEERELFLEAVRSEIDNYQNNIEERIFSTPDSLHHKTFSSPENSLSRLDDARKITYLESCVTVDENTSSNHLPPALFNPLLLRMYLEMLRLAALTKKISSVNNPHIYSKIILASLLLIRLGDATGYFCLMDIISKSAMQDKAENLIYIKKLLNLSSESEQSFLAIVTERAFRTNGVELNLDETDDHIKNSFLRHFNYTLAFFYPKTTLNLLQDLKKKYKQDGLVYFANISTNLFRCFVASYHEIFQKIFDADVSQNFELIQTYFENEPHTAENLISLSNHQQLFSNLTLAELLQIPAPLISILNSTGAMRDIEHWNAEYANFLFSRIDKLRKIASILRYWTAATIKDFLNDVDENLFVTVSSCAHREILFMYLQYDEIIFLHSSKIQNQTLLQLLCENDNQIIIKLLLEKKLKVHNLAEMIIENETLRNILSSKNSGLIFKKFPQYFHQLRSQKMTFDKSLKELLNLTQDKEFLLWVFNLSKGQYAIIEKNLELIKLMQNSLVYKYVKKYSLTFDDIQQRFDLFSFLSISANEQSHIYLLSLNLQELLLLYENNYLPFMLKIESETLFAWLLFGVVTRSKYYEKTAKQNLAMRDLDQIKILLSSSILTHLDKFGVEMKTRESKSFRHCDRQITSRLSIEDLLKLESQPFADKDMLTHILSFPPGAVQIAINSSIIPDNKRFNLEEFVNFFKLPFWQELSTSYSWMILIYLNQDMIQKLAELKIQNQSILSLLMSQENKQTFYTMVQLCEISKRPLAGEYLFNQMPPSQYAVDTELFFNLLTVICATGFIYLPSKCLLILKKFSAKEIVFLGETIIEDGTKQSILELLATLANRPKMLESLLLQVKDVREVKILTTGLRNSTAQNYYGRFLVANFSSESPEKKGKKRSLPNPGVEVEELDRLPKQQALYPN